MQMKTMKIGFKSVVFKISSDIQTDTRSFIECKTGSRNMIFVLLAAQCYIIFIFSKSAHNNRAGSCRSVPANERTTKITWH